MELAELTVRGFTEEIASASPAPGGGSAAALAGAVGAALTAMVSGLTLGRKKYEAVQELALRAQAQADALRKRLLAAMEQDTQTFLQVSAAYAMPKQTPEEKQARSSAIEQGLKACTQPPLAVMQLCAEGLELLESRIRELGMNPEDYWWYCDLRRYGSCRHAGFGLGFERMVMYLTGVSNIRDVELHPRTVGNAEF